MRKNKYNIYQGHTQSAKHLLVANNKSLFLLFCGKTTIMLTSFSHRSFYFFWENYSDVHNWISTFMDNFHFWFEIKETNCSSSMHKIQYNEKKQRKKTLLRTNRFSSYKLYNGYKVTMKHSNWFYWKPIFVAVKLKSSIAEQTEYKKTLKFQ